MYITILSILYGPGNDDIQGNGNEILKCVNLISDIFSRIEHVIIIHILIMKKIFQKNINCGFPHSQVDTQKSVTLSGSQLLG